MNNHLKPEVKALWLTALRSGEYEQGHEALRNDQGFCCLGVLCDIYRKETDGQLDWRGPTVPDGNDQSFGDAVDDEAAYPPEPVFAWAFEFEEWRHQKGVHLGVCVIGEDSNGDQLAASTLVTCNDELKLNFNQIADIIEAQL